MASGKVGHIHSITDKIDIIQACVKTHKRTTPMTSVANRLATSLLYVDDHISVELAIDMDILGSTFSGLIKAQL